MSTPDSPSTRISSHSGLTPALPGAAVDEFDVGGGTPTHGARGTRAEGAAGAANRWFETGDVIGHFTLIRLLGEGGFGQVWLASDQQLDREVAIKLPLHILVPDTLQARRFQREAEIAAKLVHPNLVPILEAVLDNDHAYIVSEYCEGPTLMQWLRERATPVPPRMALTIISQLASGVAMAHDRGLIHRDIKPSNVILSASQSASPVPRLTDFGMARTMADPSETRAGTLIGSGQYMSPEQATGNIDEHGPHSDVHALGVLLYELLTGESPFASASEIDTIRRIVSQDPPSVRQLRPSLSRDVSAVCQRCMEKHPTQRYRNATELLADLQRVLDGRPPLARPIGRLGRLWRWSNRNRLFSLMAAAAVLGLLVSTIGLVALTIQASRNARRSETQSAALRDALTIAKTQRREAEQQRSVAETQHEHAVWQERIAQQTRQQWRQTSYISDVSLAFLRFHQGHYGEVRKLLDRQTNAADEQDLRTIEWWLLNDEVRARYALWGRHAGRATELVRLPAGDSAPGGNSPLGGNSPTRGENATPTGTIVSAGLDGTLRFWELASGWETHRLRGFGNRLHALAVLPTGELVVPGPQWTLFGANLIVIDPQTGRTREALHAHTTTIESIRVSDNGSMIASGSRYEDIRCWSTKQRRSITIPTGQRQEAFGLAADGTRLTTTRRDPDAVQLWDTHSGELIAQWEQPNAALVTAAHQHDFAAYSVRNQKGIGLIDTHDFQQRRWIQSTTAPNAMEFSDDDTHLAVADARSGVELLQHDLGDGIAADKHDTGAGLPVYRSLGKFAGLGGRIEDIVFTADAEFATTSRDGMVEHFAPLRRGHQREILDLTDVEKMAATHFPPGASHPNGILALNLTNGLVYFEFPNPDNTGPPTAQATQRVVWRSEAKLNSFSLSPNEQTIAVTDNASSLHLLTNWRDASGSLATPDVRSISLPASEVTREFGSTTFSADGRFLAVTGNTGEVFVYDLSNQSDQPIVRRWYENLHSCLVFSPCTHYLFVGGFGDIEIINVLTGEIRCRREGLDPVTCACFSPTNDAVIVGLRNGAIVSLDPETGEDRFLLYGVDANGEHASNLMQLGFVNQSRLVTINDTGKMHLWDLAQQVQIGSFDVCNTIGDPTHCRCLEISDCGRSMLLGFEHGDHAAVYHWSWER